MKTICCVLVITIMTIASSCSSAFSQAIESITPNYNGSIEDRSSPINSCLFTDEYCIADANVSGRLVATLIDEELEARFGGYSVIWDGKNDKDKPVASGVCFYRLSAGDFERTRKMVLLR
ncbi:MAG: hypothetical protein KOO63_14585 [Bacteroidales bacterium]|nr:hypothetical protein [Candidatus Latescibacterota bacterium]